jgi:hypothetical protein
LGGVHVTVCKDVTGYCNGAGSATATGLGKGQSWPISLPANAFIG